MAKGEQFKRVHRILTVMKVSLQRLENYQEEKKTASKTFITFIMKPLKDIIADPAKLEETMNLASTAISLADNNKFIEKANDFIDYIYDSEYIPEEPNKPYFKNLLKLRNSLLRVYRTEFAKDIKLWTKTIFDEANKLIQFIDKVTQILETAASEDLKNIDDRMGRK